MSIWYQLRLSYSHAMGIGSSPMSLLRVRVNISAVVDCSNNLGE
ncbi:TPA: hypothetical protein ACGOW9_000590 [Streptococcus suis]